MLALGRAISRVGTKRSIRHSNRSKSSISTIIRQRRSFSSAPGRREGVPDIVRHNANIQTFKKRGDFPKAIEEYQNMLKAKVKPDAITFNLMIQIMGRINRPDKAQQFFDLMEPHSIKPNTLHYNALLNAYCGAGNMVEAENILRDMRANFVPRDQATFTIMIKAYARLKRFSDAEHHFKLFTDHVKYGEKSNQPNDAKKLALDEVLAGVMIDVYLGQDKVVEAQALLNQVLDLGLTSRADAVNSFLTSMLARPEKQVHGEVLAFLDDLQRTRGFKPDAITYHIIMSYWLRLYERRIELGAKPEQDEILKSAADRFLATAAAMISDDSITIPDYVFATMIRFAAVRHDIGQLDLIMNEMQKRRLPRSILISNTLMVFWAQYPEDYGIDVRAKLSSIVAELKTFKLKPTTITYNILLGFYASKNNVAAVTKLFTELVEANLRPDSTTYSTVLEVLQDHPSQAQTVIADIESSGIPFDDKLYYAMLKSHRILPFKKVEKLFKEVLDRGTRPDIPSEDLSEIAEKIVYSYIMQAERALGRPLHDDPPPTPTAAATEEIPKKKKKPTMKKVSMKGAKKKAKQQKKLQEQEDDVEFDEEDLTEEDLISDEELKALEQKNNQGSSSGARSVSKDQIKEQLLLTQTRAMSLYTRLRTYGISLGPRFFRLMIPLFRNDLPTCMAIAQDVFQRTKRKRAHFVIAELMLPVIRDETVLFDSELSEWTQTLKQITDESESSTKYPVMETELKNKFVAFMDKVRESLKPAQSASYQTTFAKLDVTL